MRTIIRTPIDNGRDPVGIYSAKPFKPPSEVHSPCPDDRDHTTRDSLNDGFAGLLLFVTGFDGAIIAPDFPLSIPDTKFFEKFFANILLKFFAP